MHTEQNKLLQLVDCLSTAFGPTGQEDGIRNLLTHLLTHPLNRITTDKMGNLVVFRAGAGKNKRSLLFCAHMDAIGVMVTRITDGGFLQFSPLGGFVAADLARTKVVFQKDNRTVYGVVVPAEEKESKAFTLEELYIDIGATDKAEAEALVQPGDCGTYAPDSFCRGSRLFSSYLDNRVGCAVLVSALEQLGDNAPYHDVYMVFSVQEEIGMRGAKTVAFGLQPDYAFGVDVTCTGDQPGSDGSATALLGKGAAIKVMDHSVLCSRPLIARIQQVADAHKIPWQMDIMKSGGTDAGSLQFTRDGIPTGGISVPCRYTHTPLECVDLQDVASTAHLIYQLTESEITL